MQHLNGRLSRGPDFLLRWPMLGRRWSLAAVMVVVSLGSTLAISRGATAVPVVGTLAEPITIATTDGGHMTGTQCARCHQVDAGISHPTGKTPGMGMTVPAGLPLEHGQVTCITCHEDTIEAHSANRTAGAEGGMGSLLRMDATVMCAGCHNGEGLTRQSMHPLGMTKAHLMWSKRTAGAGLVASGSRKTGAGGAFANIMEAEDGTSSCISCHDGAIASDSISSGMKGSFMSGEKGHPFGMMYRVRTAVSGSQLRPVEVLDRRVRLFNGQVGCQSCHSVYSTEKGLLTMSNTGSQLCLTCHDVK